MDERTVIEQLDPTRLQPGEPIQAGELPVTNVLAALAAGLDVATRVAIRLRPDGLVEVVIAGEIVGFVEHVAPVFVALAGSRPAVAVEVAQRRTLTLAVEALRSVRADYE